MHDHRVDAYIVSFPIGGGRTSVEVMGSGTPIIVHQNYHSSFFGGAEIIYSEAFSWRYPEELYSCLISLDQETLIKQSSLSRRHYENYHTHQIFLECLEGIKLEKETVFPPQLKIIISYRKCDFLSISFFRILFLCFIMCLPFFTI